MNQHAIPAAETDQPIDTPAAALTKKDLNSGGISRGSVRSQSPPCIADHELIRVIGRGGYGEVWLARNIMGTYRAVKIVYRDSFDSDRPYEREFSGIQNFEPISRSHESQVNILHVGRNESFGCFYYVMELADDAKNGQNIDAENYTPRTVRSELKQRGRFLMSEAIQISLSLATALKHLHGFGLIHRDIKPANIIFVNDRPKLADIGLVTETGATMSYVGTEGYLPPEGPGSVQADIYSLGKTLYELAMGKDRMDFPELPTLVGHPAEEAQLFEFNEVLLKMCHSDLQQRYRDAGELYDDLILLQAGKSIRRSRALERRLALLTKMAAAVLVLAALSLAAYLYQRAQTRANRELAARESKQRQRAESYLSTLELKEAEHFFENDDANGGVAYLARLVRENPTNRIATARLMSALTDRSFAVPLKTFSTGKLFDAAFHPTGSQFVAFSRGYTNPVAQAFDFRTGRSISSPFLHPARIREAQISDDGRLLATFSEDGIARIWSVTGELLGETLPRKKLTLPWGGTLCAQIAFSPNSEQLLTVSDNEAHLWTVPDGKPVVSFDHNFEISHVEFSRDGRHVATAGMRYATIWDAASGKLEHDLNLGDGSNCIAKFSPDGRSLLTSSGFFLQLWDLETGKRRMALDHQALVASARFSPDGSRIVSADMDRSVQVWDAENGRLLFPPLKHGAEVCDAQFDPSGERLLTWDGSRARVWDSRTGLPLSDWMVHANDIGSAQFSPDGQTVRTISKPGIVIVWDVRPGRALNLPLRRAALVPSANFSPDGTKVVTAAGGDVFHWSRGTFQQGASIWNAQTGDLIAHHISPLEKMQYAEFSPDNRKIVTASAKEARVWRADTAAPVGEAMMHKGPVHTARFSPDGMKIVTASNDKTARVWDAESGLPLTESLQHSNQVIQAYFSPNGTLVLAIPRGPRARLWNAQTGELVWEFSSTNFVTAGVFSPDGGRIAIGHEEGTARVSDIVTGAPIGEPLKHQGEIMSIRFSPDGKHVLTASEDQTARLWDANTGKPATEPLRHKGRIIAAEFSPDGRRIVTASLDSTARVWDALTGRPLTEPLREGHWIANAQFSPDGSRLLLASADELARVHDLPPTQLPSPSWLPDLAEAIAGQKWQDDGAPEFISPAMYIGFRAELLKTSVRNPYGPWAHWLLADRATRTVSFASPVKTSRYVDGLLKQTELRRLREALHLSPENAQATALLAEQTLDRDQPHALQEAEFLAERALEVDPLGRAGWRVLTRIMIQTGRSNETAQLLDRALERTNGLARGALKCEWFQNIPGSILADLQADNRFPDRPDAIDFVDRCEAPWNMHPGGELGVRLSGYLIPPKTGEYRFYLCSDDQGALFLSTDKSPSKKQRIAHEPKWNASPRNWVGGDHQAENGSQPIKLQAGHSYYIEALMKQGIGPYNLAVAWQIPGDPAPNRGEQPIPGAYLAVPAEWLPTNSQN